MDRKRSAWTSLLVAGFLSATLFFGQAAWAAEPREHHAQSHTQSESNSVDIGIHVLDWLWQALDAAWSALVGSEEGDPSSEHHIGENQFGDEQIEDPPVAEVGPGMVPIG